MTTSSQHAYEVRPRKNLRGVDLISAVLPFSRLLYGGANAISNAIGYVQRYSRSEDAVIRVYDDGQRDRNARARGRLFRGSGRRGEPIPVFRRDELHFVIILMLAKYYANAQAIVGLHAYYRCQ